MDLNADYRYLVLENMSTVEISFLGYSILCQLTTTVFYRKQNNDICDVCTYNLFSYIFTMYTVYIPAGPVSPLH